MWTHDCLFIGGPADGQTKTVEFGENAVQVAFTAEIERPSAFYGDPGGVRFEARVATYRRQGIRSTVDEYHIYVIDGMTFDEAFAI